MKTLRNEKCRVELIERIVNLTADTKALWGKMTADQMMSHLVQAGELPFTASASDRSTFMSRNVVKPAMLYFLAMPKEIPTPAEMDQQQEGRKSQGFDNDRAAVVELTNRLGTLAVDHECFPHPFFGSMSVRQWCVIAYKHTDHHLRQFGV